MRGSRTRASRAKRTPRRQGAPPSWTLIKGAVTGTVVLRFVGPTSTEEIPEFLAALSKQLPEREAHVIFDLRELEGHNLDTRAPVQRWLREHKSRIARLTVVLQKAATIVKMAATVVGLASGVRIEIRDDIEGDPLLRL
jgi:hypothetical protein